VSRFNLADLMPGPRPMPVALKLLRGNPGKRPLKRGFEPPQPPLPPDPPEFLAGDAREEWLRVAPGLHLFGLLTEGDVMPLAGYCASFARWKTALETFDRVAAGDPVMHGLLVKWSEGQPRSNPLVRIAAEAAADMLRFASEFGFTPAARSRIAAGVGGQTSNSKFGDLLL
jgi:P27 family predicted phage terminase small subunit